MPALFDPYYRWLGIPPREQPPNHYRLLGVQLYEAEPDVIEAAADQRAAHLHLHEAGPHADLAQRLLKEISAARVCLLLPERKASYDKQLHAAYDAVSDVGATLGDYLLEAKLGEGGMGVVYRARHTKLGRIVAVKVLSKGRGEDRQAVARFEREIAAIGRISHPNIVAALDARVLNGARFLVMEFVDGMHLGEILRRTGPLSVPDACALICQAAAGLQCAHENNLVHRDIKPSNLMLTAQGVVKILDLGLVRIHQDALASDAPPETEEVTNTGQAMGTVDYMSPEQVADSRSVDIRADIYSLGATCFKLLTGQAPFAGGPYTRSIDKLVARVQHDAPPIESLRPDVPPPLAAVLARTLARNPAARFNTPGELAEALRPWTAESNLPALLERAWGAAHPAPRRGFQPSDSGSSRSRPVSGSTPSGRTSAATLPSHSISKSRVLLRPLVVWGLTALATAAAILLVGLLLLAFSSPASSP